MEGRTRIFRDRVVSLDQTQEIGERHIGLLTELVVEALPGFRLKEHGLEHEADLFFLVMERPETKETRRVTFTRMVLTDQGRLPAIVEDPLSPVRGRLVEQIRAYASRAEISVRAGNLLTAEEQAEADVLEAEWRRKNEALLAARRAEEERRERERQRKRQEEDARRRAQHERERKERGAAAAGEGSGRGRGRRRRGRGGAASGPSQGAAPAQPQAKASAPPPQGGPIQQSPQASAAQPPRRGGRRRRRGRRGGGSPQTSTPAR
jgi:hypothetical protein